MPVVHSMPTQFLRSLCCFAISLTALPCCAAFAQSTHINHPTTGSSAPAPSEVIPTRQKAFSIPFTVSQARPFPTEVQLYISTDYGRTWTRFARQRPDSKEFSFRTVRDGEHWFALWTVYDSQSTPPRQMNPELRVVIDTVPPQIQLETITGTAGELAATWTVSDEHLNIESLRVHYQAVVIGQQTPAEWQEVAVDVPRDGRPRTTESGRLSWWPQTRARIVNVRAEVRDTAGNVQVVTRRVTMPNLASRRSVGPAVRGDAEFSSSSQWPADTTTTLLPGQTDAPIASTEAVPQVARGGGSFRAVRAQKPSNGRLVSSERSMERPAAPFGFDSLPRGERPRMTRSRQFNLRYDVDSVGPEGIESVTLWSTRDGGRTWRPWGTDSDNTSPFPVNVQEDGVYGFRLVVKGVNGLAGETPKTGEPADLWVGVDSAIPTGKIVSAPFGSGKETGHLIINWQAADERLAARPITLQFSPMRDGPWTSVAAGLENTGRYAWLVDPRVPRKLYLRLEVRDEAGNVRVHQPSLPINLAAMIPQGRVREFETIGE